MECQLNLMGAVYNCLRSQENIENCHVWSHTGNVNELVNYDLCAGFIQWTLTYTSGLSIRLLGLSGIADDCSIKVFCSKYVLFPSWRSVS